MIASEYVYALRSWGSRNEDCCSGWAGVGCDHLTGHVIKIDLSYVRKLSRKAPHTRLSFIELHYLKYLSLAYSSNLLANQSISTLIGNSVVSLQHLTLVFVGIVGNISHNFGSSMPALC
ncbi:unnamed protein product [Cuscuta epithymum]|uniref:Leucine-rich repeat-containing N-terminal plant-type domain-containing protein n=1 Tax=Cuscuta epithymum TaxID=186058 RepID=A0AAV0FBZ3_9ASTE|nr:unnamed protein product [Cuscuta epithymum]